MARWARTDCGVSRFESVISFQLVGDATSTTRTAVGVNGQGYHGPYRCGMVRVQAGPLLNMVSFFLLALSFISFFLVQSPYTSPRNLFCSIRGY